MPKSMAVTRASASRSTLSTPETTKNKEKKRQRTSTTIEEKEKQKKSKTCSSSLIKSTKSLGIRFIGRRIYDSENGKTCHQCRQKTVDFSVSCKNLTGEKKCTFHYCHICLLNRYGEKAEEAVELGCQWKCPSCRGICNCSKCMKKRGFRPTGILLRMAKANRFSSVSQMLQLGEIEKHEQDEGASPKKQKASNEEPAASSKEGMNANGPGKKANSTCQIKALEKVGEKENDTKEKGKNGTTMTDDPMRKEKANEMPSGTEMINTNCDIHLIDNISGELSDEWDIESEKPTNKNTERTQAGNKIVDEAQSSRKTAVEIQIKVSHIDIPLAQGTVLNRVADLDLLAEDVGNALQFLEFCEAFGQVLDLKKGQPELLLRELTGAKDSRRKRDFSVERLHIKLLSLIQNDREKGCSFLKARGRNSWPEALENYIAKCPYLSNELIWDSSELGPDKYEKLNTSNKLRILTFLCDEALGTTELRNWIDEKNSEFLEERKRAKEMFLIEEKNEKKKLRDVVAKAILLKNGVPLSIAEHENLVSVIKVEVAQSLAEKLEAANTKMKRKHSHAVRSYPILLDATGRKFWKLRSYCGEMDVLLQEVPYGDLVTAHEKWFVYDLSEKANIERYISSFKET